jgi:Putative polyhydroxyalkanoic acid system protein (PHA_gran_rgn)
MKHTVEHDLGREKAKKVAEAAWNSYSARFSNYSPSCQWESENKANIGFNVKGVSLKGSLEVNEHDIALDLDVPFLLRPFKGQALKVIEEEIRNWIGKSKAGQI